MPHRDDSLSVQQFQILLALTDEERHGYGIILDVAARTGGKTRLGTGALYTALGRLAAAGLVRDTKHAGDDPRRRYYAITRTGREALRAHVARLEQMLAQARLKGLTTPAKGRP